jgi:hypothetical protein
MCKLKVRFSQTPERRNVFNYALRVEVLSSIGIPKKIFVYHQSPAGIDGNTFAEFDHVATPVDFQEIPEDAASEVVPWYRTDKVVVWFRNVSDLNLAKQMFVDEIYALQKTYDVLTSEDNFTRQSDIEFSETGVHQEVQPGEEGSIEQDIADMKTEIDGKLSKDALDGVEFETNDAAGIREAVKIIGNALGAKIAKSIALAFGLWSLSAQGAGFSGAPYAQLDLDENPIVVTNVTFEGLATDAELTNKIAEIKAVIPSAATEQNQLADKAFVNSAIATNAALYMVSKTHAELLAMRNAGQLNPGQQYRITDYVATTNGDSNSCSANNPFDIIVTADNERTLNERARAVLHDGDTYFADCDLAAWDIWYCIDNDINRFAWADTDNGKGVIFRLIDEFRNDAPYDFKGILFRRWAVTDITSTDLDADLLESLKQSFVQDYSGLYYASQNTLEDIMYGIATLVVDDTDSVWYYTFGGEEDCSRVGYSVYANKIEEFIDIYDSSKRRLNNIVFLSPFCSSNIFGPSCYSNTFGSSCHSNTFGSECYFNMFGSDCCFNTFGSYCHSNTFGSYCDSNTFGISFHSNTFGSSCRGNTFGQNCYNNIFGPSCYSNTFGSDCSYNTFGSYCYYNAFGSYCTSNTFGSYCEYNICGANFSYNTFDFSCSSNTFGSECNNNTFGGYCSYNTFGGYCAYNTFSDDCSSNTFVSKCSYNTFGLSCYSNTFGSSCHSNTFGSDCSFNMFGSDCSSNTFGSDCSSNTFGSSCNANTFGNASSVKSFCRYIRVCSGNRNLYINPTGTTSYAKYYQNVEIKEGVNNSSTYKTINDPNVGQTFLTIYKPANSQEISI